MPTKTHGKLCFINGIVANSAIGCRSLLEKWESRVGIQVAEVRIKRMKTRWGTCNSEACRIWVNLELIKKPTSCLEFILVHEMVHFDRA